MAEWLRRLTRNQMGSSRVGSNPTRSEYSPRQVYIFDKCVDLDYPWFSRPTTFEDGFISFQHLLVFGSDKNDHQNRIQAAIAQLGERQTEDLKVPGSIPGRGIRFNT